MRRVLFQTLGGRKKDQEPVTRLPRFGAHMSIAGGHEKAVYAAHRLGFDSVQVFTKNTNQWAAKPLTDARIRAFHEAIDETGIAVPVAHTSYLINLASPDDALWHRSIEALVVELQRAEALGILDLVLHPGAHMGTGEEAGLARVAQALDVVHERAGLTPVRIDLESTAGQGSCLGHRLEHLAAIRGRVQEPERLGICLDTCHLFAAGYPLAEALQYNALMVELSHLGILEHVRVWHLNDSLRELGSRVDRHAGLGRGKLGLEPFRQIIQDSRFASVPMILETPKGREEGEELDAINLGILQRFRGDEPGASHQGVA